MTEITDVGPACGGGRSGDDEARDETQGSDDGGGDRRTQGQPGETVDLGDAEGDVVIVLAAANVDGIAVAPCDSHHHGRQRCAPARE